LYLDKDALAYPDAALGVMIKEVQHLYDNAIQVVMQGLMLPAEISQPDANIRQLVAHASPVQFKNSVDDLYERYIKVISGEIIDFGSKSQAHFSSSQGALLVELMSSCQRIVESIKATKHLNKNLRRFSESENKWVAEEYQRFRVVLAELIVELNRIRAAGKKEDVLFADRLRVSITKADSFKNGALASQIREGRFPGYIAGSIMNDSRYVSQIAFGLIDSLEVISRANTSGERSDDSLSLDETEINQLAQQNKA
jgi:phosphate:Na+ symporter